MPQTLLAIAAMMLVGTYYVTVQQHYVFTQQQDISREVEEMAGSVAIGVMEIIRSREFDQAVIDGTTTSELSDLNLFAFNNTTDHFTTGKDCSVFGSGTATCDDMDDFHGMQTTMLQFDMGDQAVFFNVDVTVQYVDNNFARDDERTFNKQVIITVQDTWPNSGITPFLQTPVQLSRVFSYEF